MITLPYNVTIGSNAHMILRCEILHGHGGQIGHWGQAGEHSGFRAFHDYMIDMPWIYAYITRTHAEQMTNTI
jgi:hypothetical protein